MKPNQTDEKKYRIEDNYRPSSKAFEEIGDTYASYYSFRNNREQSFRQLQHKTLEEFWTISRNLFWNSNVTPSEDLASLGLDFSLPFVRKEVLDFTGRLVSLNINPTLTGDALNSYAIKVLQGMYKKYRFKTQDKVEKFWQVLYSAMNGTVCTFVGFQMDERELRYLTEYDKIKNDFKVKKEMKKMWDDAFTEIVPLEEIYLEKIWERDIQKQNRTIRVKEMTWDDFKKEYPTSKYKNCEYVVPGAQIADDSLFFELLGGTQILNSDKVQVLYDLDTAKDKKKVIANGVWLDELGKGEASPNPFHHKMQPYTWSMHEPIDDKFAYGMSMPFLLKDSSKILNTSYTMMVERELRAIDPPVLSSDFEAPELIFGQQRVIPVNDVNAYKEFRIEEASGSYFTMMNSLQGLMSSFAQGGNTQIAPSKQPRSAREMIQIEKMKQQALGNTLLMYYGLVHQEIILLLKTMLQFYASGRYNTGQNLLRAFIVPNSPLSQGNVGDLEVRFVKNPDEALNLYFEAIKKSIENGKPTEIIEMPVDMIGNLEFYIDDIKLEPEKDDEMERAMFNENILQPLLNVFIPAGVADINKTYVRWLEKQGEHPSSYTSEQQMPQIMSAWGGSTMQQNPQQQMAMAGLPGGMPQGLSMNAMTGRQGQGAMTGNLNQSRTGTQFGGRSNGGVPQMN